MTIGLTCTETAYAEMTVVGPIGNGTCAFALSSATAISATKERRCEKSCTNTRPPSGNSRLTRTGWASEACRTGFNFPWKHPSTNFT